MFQFKGTFIKTDYVEYVIENLNYTSDRYQGKLSK